MNNFNKFLLGGLVVVGFSAMIAPSAVAGVSFDVRFGSRSSSSSCYPHSTHHSSIIYSQPSYHHHRSHYSHHTYYNQHSPRVYCNPYDPPFFYSNQRVVIVRSAPPAQVIYQETPTYYNSSSSTPSVEYQENSWYRLGRNWAKDLRDDVVTRDQFVSYLRSNITKASTSDYNEFRRGFLASYGVNAEAAFDKAYQLARSN